MNVALILAVLALVISLIALGFNLMVMWNARKVMKGMTQSQWQEEQKKEE